MYKFTKGDKKFKELPPSDTALSEQELQNGIINSWDLFRKDIGYPDANLIGKEVIAHESIRDRIDILAWDDSGNNTNPSLIVIELKRKDNKFQLLQAISYAAMISEWDSEILATKIQSNISNNSDWVLDSNYVRNMEAKFNVAIVLISANYHPEVIYATDWLYRKYKVDITIFEMMPYRMDNELLFKFEQKYPQKELSSIYKTRRGGSGEERVEDKAIGWDNVIASLEYDFTKEALRYCKKFKDGEPTRARFSSIRSNYNNFTWITINFRQKYLNVYIKGKYDGDMKFLKSKFINPVEINEWRDGFSIKIYKETEFRDLV